MYIYIHTYKYIYVYIYTYNHMCIQKYVHISTTIIFRCAYIHIYIYMYITIAELLTAQMSQTRLWLRDATSC